MQYLLSLLTFLLAAALSSHAAQAQPVTTEAASNDATVQPYDPYRFNSFFVTWTGNGTEAMYEYLDAARPEVAQVCFFGPMFHGYADIPKSTGYPMQLPVAGQRDAIARQKQIIQQVQLRGSKVVAHFQMSAVIEADKEHSQIFTQGFFNDRWYEDILGPRPCDDPLELLQRDAEGKPLTRPAYHLTFVSPCMSSPHARQMLKQMLDVALQCGVDGIVSNYNYYYGCVCAYCQDSFKDYLRKQYSDEQIAADLGIANLATHRFTTIPARIPGYPEDDVVTELSLAAHRWAAINFKNAYDEIFIDYGRAKKPDLILATWNHLGNLRITEERTFLPIEMWARHEDYIWYSGGYGPPTFPPENPLKLADSWLACMFIRELSRTDGPRKPFMMGKYEQVRMRNTIGEALAQGGAGMGLYMKPGAPGMKQAGTAYTRFAREHAEMYNRSEPYAEVALLMPRQALQRGKPQSHRDLVQIGEVLAASHVQFNFVIDQRLEQADLESFAAIIAPLPQAMAPERWARLRAYVEQGGTLLVTGAGTLDEMARASVEAFWSEQAQTEAGQRVGRGRVIHLADAEPTHVRNTLQSLCQNALSTVSAPETVRASVFRGIDGDRMLLHMVNYDLNPLRLKRGKGPENEVPVPAEDLRATLLLPEGAKVAQVTLISPDQAPLAATWTQTERRLELAIPRVLTYSVADILLTPAPASPSAAAGR